MPPRKTSPPAAATPAARAASSISPLSRVSRMTRTRGFEAGPTAFGGMCPDCSVAARPSFTARSAVNSSPATPRTPSVPNSLRATAGLALRELRALAGLLEAGLLALLHASVTREEAALLELGAQV